CRYKPISWRRLERGRCDFVRPRSVRSTRSCLRERRRSGGSNQSHRAADQPWFSIIPARRPPFLLLRRRNARGSRCVRRLSGFEGDSPPRGLRHRRCLCTARSRLVCAASKTLCTASECEKIVTCRGAVWCGGKDGDGNPLRCRAITLLGFFDRHPRLPRYGSWYSTTVDMVYSYRRASWNARRHRSTEQPTCSFPGRRIRCNQPGGRRKRRCVVDGNRARCSAPANDRWRLRRLSCLVTRRQSAPV